MSVRTAIVEWRNYHQAYRQCPADWDASRKDDDAFLRALGDTAISIEIGAAKTKTNMRSRSREIRS
jgi:hypothetical protein